MTAPATRLPVPRRWIPSTLFAIISAGCLIAVHGQGEVLLEGSPSESNLFFCMTSAFKAKGPQKLVWPRGSSAVNYDDARTMSLGRRSMPAVVVYAYETADVVAAAKCAAEAGYPLTAAGRRHSYQGWSIVSGYVSIDMSNVTQVVIDKISLTAKVLHTGFAFERGRDWQHERAATVRSGPAGVPNLASLIGSCPSVGITGYALGGGQGDLTPFVGLGADQVIGLEMVLWNGTVVLADASNNPDLLWASQGGGGGLGILTELTIKLHVLPDKDRFTWIQMTYNKDIVKAATYFTSWLASGKADSRLGGAGGLGKSAFNFFFVFPGGYRDAIDILRKAGLLKKEWLADAPGVLRVNFQTPSKLESKKAKIPKGLTVYQVPSYTYLEATQICVTKNYETAPWADLGYPELVGLKCDQRASLDKLFQLMGDSRSVLNTGYGIIGRDVTFATTGGRMVRSVPLACYQAIYNTLYADSSSPELVRMTKEISALGWNHVTHGAVNSIAPDATAYPWRDRTVLHVADLSYPTEAMYRTALLGAPECAAVAEQAAKAAALNAYPVAETATGVQACVAKAHAIVLSAKSQAVKQLINTFQSPACAGTGMADVGYYNYLAPNRENDWPKFYFGNNYARLQRIKAMYDPFNRFGKPFTVEATLTT